MKFLLFTLTLFISVIFTQPVFAEDCTSVPLQPKILLKITDIYDSLYLFLLVDPTKQITHKLNRADLLYKQAQKNPNNSHLAYVYGLRAENQITQTVNLIRNLATTASLNIDDIETSLQNHLDIAVNMQTKCDWTQIQQFIKNNRTTIRLLYYLRLPNDDTMQLLRGNQ